MKSVYCAVRTGSLNNTVYASSLKRKLTATFALYIVFLTEMKSVYCAVRTGSLNKTVYASCLKGKLTEPVVMLITAVIRAPASVKPKQKR
jgi:hypothetical protein